MSLQTKLEKYAKIAVKMGANVQPGQLLVISAQVRDYEFVRLCVKEAYAAGAGYVQVDWSDEMNSLQTYMNVDTETLCDIPQWMYDQRKWAQDNGCCFLHIGSGTLGLMKEVDPAKMQAIQIAAGKKFMPLQNYTMANEGQWSIVALPSAGWAKKVFPDKEEEEAMECLMDAILTAVRVQEDNDPVAEWKQHTSNLRKYCSWLNEQNFRELHFTNGLGTDLHVGLVKDHIWCGGSEDTVKGIAFNPNMPTEEVFCMPEKTGVYGKVVASLPLSYAGKLIEGFSLTFENGKVVSYHADKEEESLKNLVEFDEGSSYLGEVALISYDSPISNMGILFYNTLFDENASCHLALGRAYPMNVKGGTEMSREQLAQAGANDSMTHVDFMFGTRHMHIEGIKQDGTTVTVFDNGNFVI